MRRKEERGRATDGYTVQRTMTMIYASYKTRTKETDFEMLMLAVGDDKSRALYKDGGKKYYGAREWPMNKG